MEQARSAIDVREVQKDGGVMGGLRVPTEKETAEFFGKVSKSHPSLERGKVWCKKCGKEQKVDSGKCLRSGWPECCDETMTIDHPSMWKETP